MNTIQLKHSNITSTNIEQAISKLNGLNLLEGEPAIASYGSGNNKKQVLAIGSDNPSLPSLFLSKDESDGNFVKKGVNGNNDSQLVIENTGTLLIKSGEMNIDSQYDAMTLSGNEISLSAVGGINLFGKTSNVYIGGNDVNITPTNKLYYKNDEVATKVDLNTYVKNGINGGLNISTPEIYLNATSSTINLQSVSSITAFTNGGILLTGENDVSLLSNRDMTFTTTRNFDLTIGSFGKIHSNGLYLEGLDTTEIKTLNDLTLSSTNGGIRLSNGSNNKTIFIGDDSYDSNQIRVGFENKGLFVTNQKVGFYGIGGYDAPNFVMESNGQVYYNKIEISAIPKLQFAAVDDSWLGARPMVALGSVFTIARSYLKNGVRVAELVSTTSGDLTQPTPFVKELTPGDIVSITGINQRMGGDNSMYNYLILVKSDMNFELIGSHP